MTGMELDLPMDCIDIKGFEPEINVSHLCSLFLAYIPNGRPRKGRKNMVKDFRAAVQYFITVVSMKAKVRREAFKGRIQDITGNY